MTRKKYILLGMTIAVITVFGIAATYNYPINSVSTLSQYIVGGTGAGTVLPDGKSLYDVLGGYTDDGGGDNSDTIKAHLDLISKYVADGDGDFATGTALPANKSLYDLLGAYTADGGADDEDTIMAHLDLIYADTSAMDTASEVQALAGTAYTEKAISYEVSTITNGNHDCFTVTGGPIRIIEIASYVTTEIGAESNLVGYNVNTTTPAADTAFGTDGTALETNADAVGTLYTWDGTVATDLTATTNGVALGGAAGTGLIVPAGGTVELACANDGAVDGAITVYMRYVPLASGVTVATP